MSARWSQHGRVREDPRPDPELLPAKWRGSDSTPPEGRSGRGPGRLVCGHTPAAHKASLCRDPAPCRLGGAGGPRQPRLSPRGQGLSGAPSLTPESGISAGAEASHAADPYPQVCSQSSSFSRWGFARPSPVPSLGFKWRPPPLLTLNTPT